MTQQCLRLIELCIYCNKYNIHQLRHDYLTDRMIPRINKWVTIPQKSCKLAMRPICAHCSAALSFFPWNVTVQLSCFAVGNTTKQFAITLKMQYDKYAMSVSADKNGLLAKWYGNHFKHLDVSVSDYWQQEIQ